MSERGSVRVAILGPNEAETLSRVAPDVFDTPVQAGLAAEFLSDERHHLAVALDAGTVVGFASGVHYLHPDKRPELWINEVGVAPTHRRTGLARRLMEALFRRGRELGCAEAWVLTERTNVAAVTLCRGLGGTEPDEEPMMFSFRLGEVEMGTDPPRPALPVQGGGAEFHMSTTTFQEPSGCLLQVWKSRTCSWPGGPSPRSMVMSPIASVHPMSPDVETWACTRRNSRDTPGVSMNPNRYCWTALRPSTSSPPGGTINASAS